MHSLYWRIRNIIFHWVYHLITSFSYPSVPARKQKMRSKNCRLFVRDELKKWSSHLMDNLSNRLAHAPEKFQMSQQESNPRPLRCRCSVLSNWAIKKQLKQSNLLGSCVPVKGMMNERIDYLWRADERWIEKKNILVLDGQFEQLSLKCIEVRVSFLQFIPVIRTIKRLKN